MTDAVPSDPAEPLGHNIPILSVSELSQAVKRTVEGAFGRVRVRGEISGFKRAASGHLYLALKDADAVLDARLLARHRAAPLDRARGRPRGDRHGPAHHLSRPLQVPDRHRSMELAGEGALLKLLEERKRRLAEEGLFDEASEAPAALPARGDRRRDLADRRGASATSCTAWPSAFPAGCCCGRCWCRARARRRRSRPRSEASTRWRRAARCRVPTC